MRCINYKRPKAVAALKTNLRPVLVILLLAGLSSANSAWALNVGDILTINTGTCGVSTTSHPPAAGQGSCFGMEMFAGFIVQTNLANNNGIVIGSPQTASGAHSLPPDGSESPGIDRPWEFFNNTGMHKTNIAVTEITPNSVLNFSGWAVTWSNIANIDMGTNAHSGYTNGQAQIVCTPANCSNGATYTLSYTATVPATSPNFPNVAYSLRLEGTVVVPAGPMSLPVGIIGGSVGGAGGSIRVTAQDLATFGVPDDTGFSNSGGYYDFVTPTTVPGGTTQVVLPLTAPLPTGFVYRKYNAAGGWFTFVENGVNNNLMSFSVAPGATCPSPGSFSYHAAVAGDNCLQLTIEDGGPNDADGNATNGSVSDPGGVATPVTVFVDARTSGESGCSLSANPVNPLERSDWWLLLGFVAWLGFVIRRKRMMR